MRCPTLAELPAPPAGKTGWPWTVETPQLPDRQQDGKAWPRVSIVTPSFNQGQYIEETIRSVLLQGYPDLEYVVMDGGSTDASVEIIKRYAPWLKHWESTPDRGQAHAINKGLEKATGVWWNWINSDDFLLPGALREIGTVASGAGPASAIIGSCAIMDGANTSAVRELAAKAPAAFSDFFASDNYPVIPQPSTFLRSAWRPSSDYHYVMDWALYLRIAGSRSAGFATTSTRIAAFREHGASKTASGARNFQMEALRVIEDLRADNFELGYSGRCVARRLRSRLDLMDSAASLPKLVRLLIDHPVLVSDRMYWGAIRRRIGAATMRGPMGA